MQINRSRAAKFRLRQAARAAHTFLVGSAFGAGCSISAIAATGNGQDGLVLDNGARVVMSGPLSGASSDGILAQAVVVRNGAWGSFNGSNIWALQDGSYGVVVSRGGTVHINQNASVWTQGGAYFFDEEGKGRVHGSHAVVGEDGGMVQIDSATVHTTGDTAGGLLAQINSVQASSVVRASTTRIDTAGVNSAGAEAYKDGARIEGSSLQISTSGASSSGAFAHGGYVSLSDSSITTAGEQAHGLFASGSSARLLASGKTIVTTTGAGADGVRVAGGAQASLSGATVSTAGERSHGLLSMGEGSSFMGSDVALATTGANASGVAAFKGAEAVLTNSFVTTTGVASAGIATQGGDAAAPDRVQLDRSSVSVRQAEVIRAEGSTARIELTGPGSYQSDTGVFARAMSDDGRGSEVTISAVGEQSILGEGGGAGRPVVMRGGVVADPGSTIHLSMKEAELYGAARNVGTFDIKGPYTTWHMTGDSDVAALNVDLGQVRFESSAGRFMTLTAGSLSSNPGSLRGSQSEIHLNTVLNEGAGVTQTDLVHVTGNVEGGLGLRIANAGGTGARTEGDGIKVVQVDGTSPPDAFHAYASRNGVGGYPIEAGAYEYRLYQGGSDSPGSWYLRSELENPDASSAALAKSVVAGSAASQKATAAQPGRKLADEADSTAYRAAVPGYALAPALNLDYGFSTLGRLHERAGDIPSLQKAGSVNGKDGVWGRIGGGSLDADSGRFEARQDDYFAQFGKDWEVSRDAEGGHSNAGATVTLGSASARFEDSARAIDPRLSTRTGSLDTDAQSIGGYYTRYWGDGSYFDGVGQVTRFSNEYSDIHGTKGKQHGYAIGISGEVGKPFTVAANGFAIEPQAQLMYQYLSLDDFDDQVSSVRMDSQDQLRGRIGVRLFNNAARAGATNTFTPYVTADVLHDFLSPGTTWVGSTGFERGLAKTWYELGLGLSGTLNRNSEVYANVKYAGNIGGDSLRSVSGNLGYRYSW